VGLAEPGQPVPPGEIALGIGLSQADAAELIATLPADSVLLLEACTLPAQRNLMAKPPGVTWRQLHAQLTSRLPLPVDRLADLAQTIASLTGGLVTIEDTAARVLAYSRSSDEVDALRRLSILGRSGPEEYLSLLREWGVYERLASTEEVVEIAEHPASGVRRRLAVGVFVDGRQLATIWVQQGRTDFHPQAQQALLGAARLTAAELVGRAVATPAPVTLTELLTGRPAAGSGHAGPLAGLGRDAGRPAMLALLEPEPVEAVTGRDLLARHQLLTRLGELVRVHAVALRRQAVVEPISGRIAVLLPNLTDRAEAVGWLERALAATGRASGVGLRAGLSEPVANPGQAGQAYRQAELALSVSTAGVAAFGALRHRLLVDTTQHCLARQADFFDPALDRLVATEPELARTLWRYLDTGSDVSRIADEFRLHATTVRYRVRRARDQCGMDLTDPEVRLAAQLQLRYRLAARSPAQDLHAAQNTE